MLYKSNSLKWNIEVEVSVEAKVGWLMFNYQKQLNCALMSTS